jgi:phosphinothricin acetyltransferase
VLAAFPSNEAGMRLYRRVGFREVGVYREQGVLDGRWVDTIVMELLLDDRPPPGDDATTRSSRLGSG